VSSLYNTKTGDTISKMIEKFNCSFKSIEELNDVKKLIWLEGQKILIPLPSNSSIQLHHHIIKKNESINDLINHYHINYDEIKYFNNLIQFILDANQMLKLEYKMISPVADDFEKD